MSARKTTAKKSAKSTPAKKISAPTTATPLSNAQRARFAVWLLLSVKNPFVGVSAAGKLVVTLPTTTAEANLTSLSAMLKVPTSTPAVAMKKYFDDLATYSKNTAKNGIKFSDAVLAMQELYDTPIPNDGTEYTPGGICDLIATYTGMVDG